MIDEALTLRLFGHTFDEARYGDRIVVVCSKCHERRVKLKGAYLKHRKRTGHLDDLCRSCSKKGNIHSQEAKEKMRNAKLGKTRNLSDEVRWRMGDAARKTHTGKSKTAETREKMSTSHKEIAKYGAEHWNWKGGKIPFRTHLYHQTAYKNWRAEIFKRDDYTCQMCNERGGILQAHHIHMVSENKNTLLIFDINNGITLCKKCHSSIRNNENDFISTFDYIVKKKIFQ